MKFVSKITLSIVTQEAKLLTNRINNKLQDQQRLKNIS